VEQLVKFVIGAAAAIFGGKLMAEALYGRRKVFVSFDYENDKHYRFMLSAWHANQEFEFKFDDRSSGEVQSNDIGRIKAALANKIRECDVLLVLIGAEATKWHRDWRLIGYKNWISFEIAKARELGKRLVAVKLDRSYESPEELNGAGAAWAMSFGDEQISKALREA